MTEATVNNNFEESYVNVKEVLVTNNLGRAVEHLEIVALDGYVGEVREFDGIADTASGMINVNPDRKIYTTQIETTDTFVVGGVVYFVSGGSAAAGKLRSGYVADGIPVGVCTEVQAGTAIEFKPFVQQAGAADGIKAAEYVVDATAASGIVITDVVQIPVGARIVDVIVKCTATNSSGTLQLTDNAGTPGVITDAIACATTKAVDRAASLENDVVTADGLRVVSNGAGDRGVMTILWR